MTEEQEQEQAPKALDPTMSEPRPVIEANASEDESKDAMPQNAIRPVEFAYAQAVDAPQANNIDLLLDVPLELTVELGRTTMSLRSILALGSGSVIELEKLAGDPVDILVNNRLIATGEVVVVDDAFGIRIADILDPKKRIESLG